MKILFIGWCAGQATSRHRLDAMLRLGHVVHSIDPYARFRQGRLRSAFRFRTGYIFLQPQVCNWLADELRDSKFDLAWIDNGELLGSDALRIVRKSAERVINYNCDDPTGGRDKGRWRSFRRAIPFYDLCAVVRRESEQEYPDFGSKKVLRVWRSADEIAHRPRTLTAEIERRWSTDVAFVGTWMPERGALLATLADAGLNLGLWGDRWQYSPEWSKLRRIWRGPSLAGDDYAHSIQSAKISLGLVSEGNRDLHTQRSAEIPMLGGFFCAKRTSEHVFLYRENIEAAFWTTAAECVFQVKRYLANEHLRATTAAAGQRRCWEMKLNNEAVVGGIIHAVS